MTGYRIDVRPPGGTTGVLGFRKVADDAARLALLPLEGDFVIQLDTDTIYYYNGATWEIYLDDSSYDDLLQVIADLAAHLADGVDAHDASAISVVPAGNLSSIEVQAALEELQGDIDALAAALAAHLADATDAHDASAISVVPTGNLAADDVQEALDEHQLDIDDLYADLAAHLADAVDAHLASAIGFTPAGNIAATEVQAAIEELDSETDARLDILEALPRAFVIVANTAFNDTDTFDPADNRRQVKQVSGNGGPVSLTDIDDTNAQEGDELVLLGTSNANTVTLNGTANLVLNGSVTLGEDDQVYLVRANAKWREISRSA